MLSYIEIIVIRNKILIYVFFLHYIYSMNSIAILCIGIILQTISNSLGADPKFETSTKMRLVLVPADAAVGSVIYRLRATDEEFDYPLQFELVGMYLFL